jgi:protein phosphatase
MGGHNGGEVASQKGVEFFCRYAQENVPAHDFLTFMAQAVQFANSRVFALSQADPELSGMGATFSALVVDQGTAWIAHVGDSRVYSVKAGQISQLTVDHTFVNEMVRAGRLTEAEARTHPRRNIITRALGSHDEVAVDTYAHPLAAGEVLVLCSDGLTNMISDEELLALAAQPADPEARVSELINLSNQHGGVDNISVVLVDLER